MSKNQSLQLAALSALMLIGYSPVMASEPLTFNYVPNPLEQNLLNQLIEKQPETDFEISAVDLNSDGMSEFILKSSNCKNAAAALRNYCHYLIIAQKNDDEITTLGNFQAKSLILSNNFFKGIRELHVYNVKENDYDYNIARWNSEISGYEIIKNGS